MFGPPGSGKGTQSKKLAEKYNLKHISTGDIFRKEMKEESELGKRVKDLVERGELVPDELLIEIIKKTIQDNADARGLIFDGFPRTIKQAEDFDKLLEEIGSEIARVIRLKVSDDEIINRLMIRAQQEGRKDDNIDVIANRLAVYREKTLPMLEYYNRKGLVKEVDGEGKIDEIFARLSEEFENILNE